MGRRRIAACVFLLVLAAGTRAQAHFEHMVLSARAASLGGAFVALADDPSAVVDNPAGLCGIQTLSFLSTYDNPYGVDGVDEGYLSAVIPTRAVALGVSWFHRGVRDALGEDMVTVALGRDLKRTSEDASRSVGASVDFAHVSVSDGLDASANAVSVGAGVLLRPFAFIGLGYSIRNLNQPEFDLIDGGGATPLSRAQAFGLSYYWQNRLVVTMESRQGSDGTWRNRGGIELRVENHLMLRGGLDEARAAAGVGITWSGITLDAAMISHDALGATYLFTLRYTRPGAVRPY